MRQQQRGGWRLVPADGAQPSILLLPGRNRVGRDPDANIALKDQLSVSRNHCDILVEDGRVTIEDHSSLGTSVDNDKVAKNVPVPLESGRSLRFGDMPTSFILVHEPLVLGFTNGTPSELEKFKSLASQIGAGTYERWHPHVSIWILGSQSKMTVTVLLALGSVKQIVSLRWLEEVARSRRLVSTDAYPPSLDEVAERLERTASAMSSQVAQAAPDYRPNPRRKTLFQGMTVVLNDPVALSKESELLAVMGAKVVSPPMKLPANAQRVSVLVGASKDLVSADFSCYPRWTRLDLCHSVVKCAVPEHLVAAASSTASPMDASSLDQTRVEIVAETPFIMARSRRQDAIPPAQPKSTGGERTPTTTMSSNITTPVVQPLPLVVPLSVASSAKPASKTTMLQPKLEEASSPAVPVAEALVAKPISESARALQSLLPSLAQTTSRAAITTTNQTPMLPSRPAPVAISAPKSEAAVPGQKWITLKPRAEPEQQSTSFVHNTSGMEPSQVVVCEVVPLVVDSCRRREEASLTTNKPMPGLQRNDFKKFRKNAIQVCDRPLIKGVDSASQIMAPEAMQEAFRQMEEDEIAAMNAFGATLGKRGKPGASSSSAGGVAKTTRAGKPRAAAGRKQQRHEETSSDEDDDYEN